MTVRVRLALLAVARGMFAPACVPQRGDLPSALQGPSPRPELRHSCVGLASTTGHCRTPPDGLGRRCEEHVNTSGGSARMWRARQDSNLRPSD